MHNKNVKQQYKFSVYNFSAEGGSLPTRQAGASGGKNTKFRMGTFYHFDLSWLCHDPAKGGMKAELSFFILIFTCSIILLPSAANAALIVNRPMYLGLTDGLVGYWSFDGPDMAKGTNNTWALDRSGQGNNGVLKNMATSTARVAGKIGQALDFDGVNDYINPGNPASLQLTGAMSISAWVYWNDGAIAPGGIFSRIGSDGNRGYDFVIDDNPDGQLTLQRITSDGFDATAANAFETTKFPQGRWIHVVGTYEPSVAVRVYRDSVLVASDTTSVPASQFVSSNNPLIGARFNGTGGFFKGFIDDVRVYNRVLTPDEIKRLYKMGR